MISVRFIISTLLFLITSLANAQTGDHLITAKQFIESDQYELALAELKTGLEELPPAQFDSLRKAAYYDELTFVKILQSDLEAALQYNSLSESLKSGAADTTMIPNYRHLGLIYVRMREFPRARHYLDIAFYQASISGDAAVQAKILGDLADWYFRLGDFDHAAEYFHRALSMFESLDKQSTNQALTHMALGAVYFENGSPGRASIEYETARDMLVTQFGEQHVSLVPVLTGEGRSLMSYGDFAMAEARLDQALQISKIHFGESHPETAKANLNLAVLKLNQQQPAQATEIAEEVGRIMVTHSTAFPERGLEQEQIMRLYEIRSYIALAEYFKAGDPEMLNEAREFVDKANSLFDLVLQGFNHEIDRLTYLRSHRSFFDLAMAIDKARWDASDLKTEISTSAFQTIERNKALVLNSMIHDVQVKKISGIPGHLVEKEQQLKSRIIRINTEKALLDPNNPAVASLGKELIEQENDYEQFIDQLEKSFPQFYDLRFRKKEISVEAVRSVLAEDDALLSYYLEDSVYHILYLDHTNLEWFTFSKDVTFDDNKLSKTPTKFNEIYRTIFGKKKKPEIQTGPVPTKLVDSQPAFHLDDAVRFYTKAIKKYEKELFVHASRSLYEKLIYPVKDLIKNKKHLVIIPHGELHYVPFEAILTEALPKEKMGKYQKFPYLIKDYSISYHHSAALFYETRQRTVQAERSFVGFAPVFNDSLKNGWVWNSRDYLRDTTYYNHFSNLRSIAHTGKPKFKELKYSKDEVVTIAQLFAKKEKDSEVFLHSQASEYNFKSKSRNAAIVHVASHSFVNYASPESSGLAFALPEDDPSEDGILYTPETFNLNLSADLLVLSSCESGAGTLAEGEGLLSLTRGFIFSGVRNALVSLWRVSDRTTSKFMVEFYKAHLTDNESYHDALRSAKLKAISNEKTAPPRNWCSFILIGE